jgi:acyl-CoA synthetase (AMP-forming)/AMP-acid ligase II
MGRAELAKAMGETWAAGSAETLCGRARGFTRYLSREPRDGAAEGAPIGSGDEARAAPEGVVPMIYRSPYPDVSIPDVSLTGYVFERATERADRPALVDGPTGRTLSYAQLAGAVRSVGAGLHARGFAKGDVFAMFSPNVPEFAVAFHGVISIGGVVSTINSLYTADEVALQLRDSGARLLLTVAPFMDRASEAAKKAGIEEVFVLGDADDATPFADLLQTGGELPDVEIDPRRDLAVLPYSSGTTGLPKGVMLTHRNLVSNLCQIAPFDLIRDGDRVIGILPFFHIYGMVVILNAALYKGATVVTMPKFDLEPFLQTMQQHRINRAFVVPPTVLALAKHPAVEGFDLSAVELIVSGAAPLHVQMATACAERLGCAVIQGYGLTETSPVTNIIPGPEGNKAGSVGPLVPNTEARVVDWSTGENLPPNEDGEIWIRGPQVMAGYLNNPEATAGTVDEDGWLHTGDIGHADEDGFFFIVDRLKELIKYSGYQVAPAVLEAVLLTHPAIADAAVIPTADEEAGEVPKAFVVLRSDATPEEIMAFVADRVAPHEKVRGVEVIDQIPKSASGKILRRVLVEREREARNEP